jgi:predicted  nucleic acid-binding Zn-ribbon protein
LLAENVSKDIAAFRTQLQLALDTIHKAQSGQALDTKTLSVAIINMEKIQDSVKKRVEAEQRRKIVVKPNKADEAALKLMMRQVKEEEFEAEVKKGQMRIDEIRDRLKRAEELIKELMKMQAQAIEQPRSILQ